MKRDNKREFRYVESLAEVIAAAERVCSAPHKIVAARFPGRCYLCTAAIVVGDSIAWKPGFPAVHEPCHRAALAPKERAA